jgi:zinc protease
MSLSTILLSLCVLSPEHPKDIVFPEYVFTPPAAEEYVDLLDNGVPVFIAEDRELPLIQVVATFRGGDYLDDVSQVGVTKIMATLMRSGGTADISAEDLDEEFAFLAANVGVNGGRTTVTASLNCLSHNFDRSFELFLDMIKDPGFQESKLQLEIDDLIEGMKQRNDHPSGILRREFSTTLFGDSYLGRKPVSSGVLSITVDNLQEQYSKIVQPSNLILSVSGDFEKAEMLAVLNEALGDWAGDSVVRSPPDVLSTYDPGIYYVDQDVPQGGVRIGLRTVKRDDPDAEAMTVMNYILGGGGFSSRITQRVRSDEGLAYSAGSRFSAGPWSKGTWAAGYESKNSTVALAAMLVFEEIERMKTELVSEKDLALAKNALIEQFPTMFQSTGSTLGVFVNDAITGREDEYWNTYRDRIGAITAEDVQRVANRILKPQEMVVVMVGNWDEIQQGDTGGRATIEDVHSVVGGEIVELPLRNPLTLEILD